MGADLGYSSHATRAACGLACAWKRSSMALALTELVEGHARISAMLCSTSATASGTARPCVGLEATAGARDVGEIAHGPTMSASKPTRSPSWMTRWLASCTRIDALAAGQHTAVVPVAVAGEVGVVEQRPQLGLGHARAQVFELGDAKLGDGAGPADAGDLVFVLDHPRSRSAAHVDDLDLQTLQGLGQLD